MEAIVNTISDLLAAILARFGYIGRARRRDSITQDIALLERLRQSPDFGPESNAHGYLSTHITSEVAEFAGANPKSKKKISWAAVILSLLIGGPFAYLTYTIVDDGFEWYALPPGIIAGLMLIAALGLITQGEPADDK